MTHIIHQIRILCKGAFRGVQVCSARGRGFRFCPPNSINPPLIYRTLLGIFMFVVSFSSAPIFKDTVYLFDWGRNHIFRIIFTLFPLFSPFPTFFPFIQFFPLFPCHTFCPLLLHGFMLVLHFFFAYFGCQDKYVFIKVLLLNSEHIAHAWRKIGLFGEKFRFFTVLGSNQRP